MPYEDWWWDVIKEFDDGSDGSVFVDKKKVQEENQKTSDDDGNREIVDPQNRTKGTPLENIMNRTEGEGKPRYETDKERAARKKRETEEKNRAYVSERGYDKIKKPANKKKEGWWGKIKQRNLIPLGGRKINENVPLVGGKRVPTMNLDDIDRATDNPGTKASRAIDRTKAAGYKKLQDRHRKKRFQEHLKTPEGQAQLAAEKERRKKAKLAERASEQGNTSSRQEIYDKVDEIAEQRPPPSPTTGQPPKNEVPEEVKDAPDELDRVEANETVAEAMEDIWAGHKNNPEKTEQMEKLRQGLNNPNLSAEEREAFEDVLDRLERGD